MTGVAELNKRWKAIASHPIASNMAFDGDFLVLGAGTRLAKIGAPIDEHRLAALLSVAHGHSISPSSLRYVRRSLETWPGDKPLALTHLALSGLAKLANPEECSWRLFVADALIKHGVEPRAIVKGLGLDSLDKYSPDQPRVPAGNPDGGQWTSEDPAGVADSPHPQRPKDIHIADSSATRGNEIRSDDAPETAVQVGALQPTIPSSANAPIDEAADQSGFHNAVRDKFAEDLASVGNTVLKEVSLTLRSDPPVTAVVDIMFRTPEGEVYAIDVKTGDNSQFTLGQQIVYPHVELGNLVASDDPRISALALTQNVPLPPIPVVVLYAHGPGEPMLTYPLQQFMRR